MSTLLHFTVTCPSCGSEFPVDPDRVPVGGVPAICSTCLRVFRVEVTEAAGAEEPFLPAAEPSLETTDAAAGWEVPEAGDLLESTEPEVAAPEGEGTAGDLELPGQEEASPVMGALDVEVPELVEPEALGGPGEGREGAADVVEAATDDLDVAALELEGWDVGEADVVDRDLDAQDLEAHDEGADLDVAAEGDAEIGSAWAGPADLAAPEEDLEGMEIETIPEEALLDPGIPPVDEAPPEAPAAEQGSAPVEGGAALAEEVSAPAEEGSSPAEEGSSPAEGAPTPAEAGAVAPSPEVEGGTLSRGMARFGRRDPRERARRLARVLVSDMITYHPARYEEGLENGTLRELFEEEVDKSWKEFVDQVGEELAESSHDFVDALNEILARGETLYQGPGRPR
jgi:predicted Zn finger-like uncharacterized protein